jgi:chemotaxis family two-component system response regulator Rcp1
MAQGKLIEILLVEDNPGDAELAREGFAECRVANNIHVAEDGEEALDFLYRRGKFGDALRPDVILLDLNMPRKNGKEVLKIIKEDEDLCDIPVVVLTSSAAEQDIIKSYKLHANCYIIKPVNLGKFLEIVKAIENFWLQIVKLPPHHP